MDNIGDPLALTTDQSVSGEKIHRLSRDTSLSASVCEKPFKDLVANTQNKK